MSPLDECELRCAIEGCDAPHYARTWCKAHYARWLHHGSTDLMDRRKTAAPCSAEGCERDAKTRGMCGMHAERERDGRPIEGAPLGFRHLAFDELHSIDEAGCWVWRGGVKDNGYGSYRSQYAHRVSYELHVGPIPEGLHVDHLCRNTLCVNPAHLEAVTPRLNMLRGIAPSALAVQNNRCKRGHEFTPDNTYTDPRGGRRCRACRADYLRNKRSEASHVSA